MADSDDGDAATYYFESEEEGADGSLFFRASYWALMTMTTVGHVDIIGREAGCAAREPPTHPVVVAARF